MTFAGILASKHDTAERIEHDHYPTPHDALDAIAARWHWKRATKILDIGAGDGRFGLEFAKHCLGWPNGETSLDGVELREVPKPKYFDNWYTFDFRSALERLNAGIGEYDYIVGNPPFNAVCRTKQHPQGILEAAYFHHLSPNGRMLFLLPDSFLYGIDRNSFLFTDMPPYRVMHLTPRIDFTGSGNPHQNQVLVEWRKDEPGNPRQWISESWNWDAYQVSK